MLDPATQQNPSSASLVLLLERQDQETLLAECQSIDCVELEEILPVPAGDLVKVLAGDLVEVPVEVLVAILHLVPRP